MTNESYALRGLAGVLFLTAGFVMLFCTQKIDEGYTEFVFRSNDWSGLLFCVFVNFIVSGYNFLVMMCIPRGDMAWTRVVICDVIMNILVGATLGAGWEIYELIIEGTRIVNWGPICEVACIFCRKVLVSLIITTLGFLFSIGLLMWTLLVVVGILED